MAVIVLRSTRRLERALERLRDGDVLVLDVWRVVLAADPAKRFWLEGYGRLHSVPQGAAAAAEIRRLITSKDIHSGAAS